MIKTDMEALQAAFMRNEKTLRRSPSAGQKTGRVKVCGSDGLACQVESGGYSYQVDMPEQVGGRATAPTPGMYEAAALGSCMVIMAKMWAARYNVPIHGIEVDVEFDADMRYLFGIDGVPARWKAIRYHISVESPAPEADVLRVLEKAHQQSHVRGDFEHTFKVDRTISIIPAVRR